jgi:hypothetical protein
MADQLRPQDLAVALRLAHHPGERYEALADVLGLSLSATHRAVQRLQGARLLLPGERKVNRGALLEFLIHGARYAFPGVRGPEVRGVPTAWSVPELMEEVSSSSSSTKVVWPHARGKMRGESITPLYDGVAEARQRDEKLYRALALVDALRVGQARERRIASELLKKELAPA